jgi:hypothetical protein
MTARCQSGAAPSQGRSEAEYIAIRRFTASAVSTTMIVGAFSDICWSAANCEAPAMTKKEKAKVSTTSSPASVATTPKTSAKGPTTSVKGSASRAPRQKADMAVEEGIGRP